MPSFDVVSEVDIHQLTNAVDQAARIVGNRFDFKGVDASFVREGRSVALTAEAEFQVSQMEDMLRSALIKCDIDPGAMDCGDIQTSGKVVRQTIVLRHGLDSVQCKSIVKRIKDAKMKKVQAAIQGDTVRISSPGKDELQAAIALLKQHDFGVELKFGNFRSN